MRPKVVVLTLVVALIALGLIAVFKGAAVKKNGDAVAVDANVQPSSTNAAVVPDDSSNNILDGANPAHKVEPSEELLSAMADEEKEEINELLREVDGSNNVAIITAIIEKLSNPSADVRHYALDAFRQMNDTNAVPNLLVAAENTKDPREKVAVLDVIDYLKMPNATDNIAPDLATNNATHDHSRTNTDVHYNPAFIKAMKNSPGRRNDSQVPANQNQ
jgi:HEAT repeat protein